MSKNTGSDDTFDIEVDDKVLENYEETEYKKTKARRHIDARRRLEKLKEDKELERLMKGDSLDWY